MAIFPIERITDQGLNKYEAVIVAAQHARQLNTRRLQALERLEEDPDIEVEPRKITMLALRDVLDGKVKFDRGDSM
ncbi:MAG: DNA-directed RNA polymerase subunit omega [bacterium]